MIFNRNKKNAHKPEEPVKAPEPKQIKDTFVPDEHGEIIVDGYRVHAKLYQHHIDLLSLVDEDIKKIYEPWAGRVNGSTIINAQQTKNVRLLTDAIKDLVEQLKAGDTCKNYGRRGEDNV